MFSAGSGQRDQPLLTVTCGLREPQQFMATELYRYYHMSVCYVRGRVRSPETFRLLPGTKDVSLMALDLSLPISASSFPCTHLCFSRASPGANPPGQMWRVLLTGGGSVMLPCLIQPACSASPSAADTGASYMPGTVLGTGNPDVM